MNVPNVFALISQFTILRCNKEHALYISNWFFIFRTWDLGLGKLRFFSPGSVEVLKKDRIVRVMRGRLANLYF